MAGLGPVRRVQTALSSIPSPDTRPLTVCHLNILLHLLSNSKIMRPGKQAHQHIIVHGLSGNSFIATKLIQMYADCDDISSALHLFDQLPEPNVFAWTSMISFFSRNTLSYECVITYAKMKRSGVLPDKFIFPRVLRACSLCSCLEIGTQVHKDIIVSGSGRDMHVGNSLIDMYSKCGDLHKGRLVFDLMVEKDLCSWNSIISGYVCNDFLAKAVELWGLMRIEGFEPDIFTFNTVMDAHCRMGHCNEAREIFKQIKNPTVVSWTTLISGYSRIGKHDTSLEIFKNMMSGKDIYYADLDCLSSVLSSCQRLKALRIGREIHAYGIKGEWLCDFYRSAGPALVLMYSKCGKIECAMHVFDLVDNKLDDTVAWNAMILGFAEQGEPHLAVRSFRKMQKMRIRNDQTTITAILRVCDLAYGKQIHTYVCRRSSHNIIPVWNALMHMYAKCGCIKAAHKLFSNMSNKDLVSWNTMIRGFGMHGFGESSLQLLEEMKLSGILPNSLTITSALSACSHSGLIDQGVNIFKKMTQEGYYCALRMEHFTCVIDLLTRAGRVEEAVELIVRMRVGPAKQIWGSLLSAAVAQQNIDIAVLASKKMLGLEPQNAGHYVTLSNLYARGGRPEEALGLRKRMESLGLVKQFGRSWVEA